MIYGIGYQFSLMLISLVSEMRCFKFRHDVKSNKHLNKTLVFFVKAGPLRLEQLTNTLKIRILSQTSVPNLMCHASIILTVGFQL